ncbi:MAG TPA: hypothetical protein VGP07_26300 [Polyangia bacterium]|jgi:hypothetical protein
MSLAFTGRHGDVEIPWLTYALLRDNVQHHLERDHGAFTLLHRVSEALGEAPVRLPAAQFNRELQTVREQLLELPIEDLAMATRTRALLHLQWPELGDASSQVVGPLRILGQLVIDARTLGDVFDATISELLALNQDAGPEDEVEISDH